MKYLTQISQIINSINAATANKPKKLGYIYTQGKSPQLYTVNREDGRVLNTIGTYNTGKELLIAVAAIQNVFNYM